MTSKPTELNSRSDWKIDDINSNNILTGGPKLPEHRNRPIFSTELGNIVHIFEDFGNRNPDGHRNFHFDRYLTDILK